MHTRPWRIEDMPGFVAPALLRPVVPVTDQGAEVECPRCKVMNRCPFGAPPDDRIQWWPDKEKGHCLHFQGVYSTGDFRTVQASFR